MRWSIIRVIWLRELRDQLRDRRTVFMMAVLPLLLYPALGFGVIQFALSYVNRQSVVGVYGGEQLTAPALEQAGMNSALLAGGPTTLPAIGGNGVDTIALSLVLTGLARQQDRCWSEPVEPLPL